MQSERVILWGRFHFILVEGVFNKTNIPHELVGSINKGLHLARNNCARIFSPQTLPVPRSENCEFSGTDNVQGQISKHIFARNEDYCVYYPPNIYCNMGGFENWGMSHRYSPVWEYSVM